MLKWLRNFHTPEPTWKEAFEMLQTLDPLKDGSSNNYASGVTVEDFNVALAVQHGGSIGDFRTFVRTFPNEQIDLVVLTNFNRANPGGKINTISRIFYPEEANPLSDDQASAENDSSFQLADSQLEAICGEYWSPELETSYILFQEQNQLKVRNPRHGIFSLDPLDEDRFKGQYPLNEVSIKRAADGLRRQDAIYLSLFTSFCHNGKARY